MGSRLVVVDEELLEDRVKVAAAKYQKVIEQLPPRGTYPALCI